MIFPLADLSEDIKQSIYIVLEEALLKAGTEMAILHTLEIRCNYPKVAYDTPINRQI
jgi:hypothetical protein